MRDDDYIELFRGEEPKSPAGFAVLGVIVAVLLSWFYWGFIYVPEATRIKDVSARIMTER